MTNSSKQEYRNQLIHAEQKSQNDYDKSIISLSGGALGISLLFYRDVVGERIPVCIEFLIFSWGLWAASIVAVVLSYFFSRKAIRKAIIQTDEGDYSEGVGGWAATWTSYTNILSGICFVLAIVSFLNFSFQNIQGYVMNDRHDIDILEKGITPPPPAPEEEIRFPLEEGIEPPPPPIPETPTPNDEE